VAGTTGFYRGCCSLLGRTSVRGLRANLTLANSRFIAEKIRQTHGIDSLTLFPPVPGGFPDVAWGSRQDAFVGIGRFAPEKRWEQAFEIIRRVREAGRDVRLTLIATRDHPDCEQRVRQLAERYPWVTLHTNLPRREMVDIVARHRYGIHLMEDEHFGIAPAEEQRGGCIPFVHRSGGPMEIVGHDDRLMFRTTDEAVEGILPVLASPQLQLELCRSARRRAELYSCEQFVAKIREVVAGFPNSGTGTNPSQNCDAACSPATQIAAEAPGAADANF
jgi:glycosyltransferase involved in cell wall biosynthesis